MISSWELIRTGGPFTWLVIGCGITALGLALERFFYLRAAERGSGELLPLVMEKVKRSQIKEAVQACEGSPLPVARILKAGILKYDRSRSQVREALEDAAVYEIPLLERNLAFLSTIAHLAPLLGLLGTIAGMVNCFYAVSDAGAAGRLVTTADVSAGMWQALITASGGLTVAIPSFAAYNYLVGRVQRLVLDMEKAAIGLMNVLGE